jgi:hypothetical protein
VREGDSTGRQKTHRAHNQDLARVARFRAHPVSFLCECGAPTCEERVHLRVADYETIVAERGRYVVAPGHDLAWERSRSA